MKFLACILLLFCVYNIKGKHDFFIFHVCSMSQAWCLFTIPVYHHYLIVIHFYYHFCQFIIIIIQFFVMFYVDRQITLKIMYEILGFLKSLRFFKGD